MMNKSHGNQQRSSRPTGHENVQRLSRKGVEPSGSKRGASMRMDGDIVWPSLKDEEGQPNKAKLLVTNGLAVSLHITECTQQLSPRTPSKESDSSTRSRQLAKSETVLPLGEELHRLMACAIESAQPERGNQRAATHSSSHYIPHSTARRCRGYSPLSNRLGQCRSSESPFLEQCNAGVYPQLHKTACRCLRVFSRNRRKASVRLISLGGV